MPIPLRSAMSFGQYRLHLDRLGPEHQFMCLVPAPDLETTLQSPQQPNRVGSWLLFLKPIEQLARRPLRLGLEPAMQLRRHRHKRVRTPSATLGLLLGVCWSGAPHPPARPSANQTGTPPASAQSAQAARQTRDDRQYPPAAVGQTGSRSAAGRDLAWRRSPPPARAWQPSFAGPIPASGVALPAGDTAW